MTGPSLPRASAFAALPLPAGQAPPLPPDTPPPVPRDEVISLLADTPPPPPPPPGSPPISLLGDAPTAVPSSRRPVHAAGTAAARPHPQQAKNLVSMHSAAALALAKAAAPAADKRPVVSQPQPATDPKAAAKLKPPAPTAAHTVSKSAATTAAALQQASQLPLPEARAAPAGAAQPAAAPKPAAQSTCRSVTAPATRQAGHAKSAPQQAATGSISGSARTLSTSRPAVAGQCQQVAGKREQAQGADDGELLLSPASHAAARRSISPGVQPIRRRVPSPRPPAGPPLAASSASHPSCSTGGSGGSKIGQSRGTSPPTSGQTANQQHRTSISGLPPVASVPWLQPAAVSPPAWLHNFLPPMGGWGAHLQQPPPDLYHRGLHQRHPAGLIPPWQPQPIQNQVGQQPQHYLYHLYQAQKHHHHHHHLHQQHISRSRSSSPAGSQHSSPHNSVPQLHHYTGKACKTPPAATYQQQLHAAAGLSGKISKSARQRQNKQRRKAAAAAALAGKQAHGKQKPPQTAAQGSRSMAIGAMAPLTPEQAQAAVPSAKTAVDQIAAGIERLGISKAGGSGPSGGSAPFSSKASKGGISSDAGGAPLQLPAARQSGGSDFLTLKEYKLMVEAGQLAPYKGSMPSADAKYAAGWAMKRKTHVWAKPSKSETGRRLLAVDTNVLMERAGRAALTAWLAHADGAAALLIPHVVLSELDGIKKGACDRARASRDASRFLEDLAARDRQALRFASREEERLQMGAGPGPRRGDVRIMDCVRCFQLGGASVALVTDDRNLALAADAEVLNIWTTRKLLQQAGQP